jgi:hypothetical protein
MRIGLLAVASAIAIWIAVADSVRRSTTLDPTEIETLLVLLIAGCLLDLVVGYRAFRGRVGWPALIWLGLRVLISGAGWLLITLPSYAIAAIALTRWRATRPATETPTPGAAPTPADTPTDPPMDASADHA